MLKLPFSKGLFQMFIFGSLYCTLIGRSPEWTVLPKMNNCCYCHPIGRSPKWTAPPKMNNCCSCPPIGCSPKWALPTMNIWKKPSENGRFRTQNVNKIGQKNCVIRYLCWEGILGEKISAIGHSIPYRLSHPPIRGSHPVLYFTTQRQHQRNIAQQCTME